MPIESHIDHSRLLKLRLIVARHGEMDVARWWNTNGVLGGKGNLLMSRRFPRTHHFAQARRNLSTTMGHSTGLIREQCPVW